MLRGTHKNANKWVVSRKPTLQNQITSLRRQVNRQKPETQYYRTNGSHGQILSVDQSNYLITQSLISASDFRDNVTGDSWVNLFLKIRLHTSDTMKACRVIVYVPKKSGSRFTPSSHELVSIPDPTKFWVLMDTKTPEKNYGSGDRLWSRIISLRKLKSLYDSGSATIERGEVILSVISYGGAGSTTYTYGYELGYHNL